MMRTGTAGRAAPGVVDMRVAGNRRVNMSLAYGGDEIKGMNGRVEVLGY